MAKFVGIKVSSRPIRRARYFEYPPDYPRRSGRNRGPRDRTFLPPCYVVHATGSVISIWDAEKLGCARWEGRWLVKCSLHGTQAWYSGYRKAIEAAKTATFCRRCYDDAWASMPCPYCSAPKRGCALCQNNNG